MTRVTMHAAKTRLSQLVAMAEAGEEVVILRGSVAVARLVPIVPAAPRREFGALRGVVSVGDAFFERLPEDELDAWER